MEQNYRHKGATYPRAPWKLADVVDYELYLQEAHDQAPGDAIPPELKARLEQALGEDPPATTRAEIDKERRWWLLQWTRALREAPHGGERAAESAGQVCASALGTITLLFALVGALSGFGVLTGLISSAGRLPDGAPVPVNVGWVAVICVLPQVIMLLLALGGLVLRTAGATPRLPVVLRLVLGLLQRVAVAVMQGISHQLGSVSRARLRSAAGLVLGRGQLHRGALSWPLLKCLQVGGTAYSLAMVLSMLALPQVRHITFGWQTSNTSVVTPQLVHNLAEGLALPWAWLGRGDFVPTVEEIAGSQIRVDRGTADLAPDALVAWWPFLCLCLVTYTLLPRLLLLLYTIVAQRRSLAAESFQDSRSDLLVGRIARAFSISMTAADAATPLNAPGEGEASTAPSPSAPAPEPPDLAGAGRDCVVVLATDLDTPQTREQLTALAAAQLGWRVAGIYPVHAPAAQEAFLAELAARKWPGNGVPRVLFVKRGNDPIAQGFRAFTQKIAKVIAPHGHLTFALGGKVNLLADAVPTQNVDTWSRFADEMKLQLPSTEVVTLTT